MFFELLKSPVFYIFAGALLVFIYIQIYSLVKKKSKKTDKSSKKSSKNESTTKTVKADVKKAAKEEVISYDDFYDSVINEIDKRNNLIEQNELSNNDNFDDKVNDFLNSEDNNDAFMKDFFGVNNSDIGNSSNIYEYPEYDYNAVWSDENAIQVLEFDYEKDVNEMNRKHHSKIYKQIKNLSKMQKALIFEDILK